LRKLRVLLFEAPGLQRAKSAVRFAKIHKVSHLAPKVAFASFVEAFGLKFGCWILLCHVSSSRIFFERPSPGFFTVVAECSASLCSRMRALPASAGGSSSARDTPMAALDSSSQMRASLSAIVDGRAFA
jgi:hypothetical protein